MVLCLVALCAVAGAQCVGSFVLGYGLRQNAAAQGMLAEVRVSQMYGGMKHDGIQSDVLRMTDAAGRHDDAARKSAAEAIDKDIGEIENAYGEVFGHQYSPGLQAAVDTVREDERQYVAQARAVSGRVQAHPEDYHQELARFGEAFNRLEASQNSLSAALKREMADGKASADRLIGITALVQLVIMALGVAAMVWAVRLMLHAVAGPIGELAEMMRRMARGDYSQTIAGDENGDEIAQMAASTRVFRETALAKMASDKDQQLVVGELTRGLGQLAEKDLEYRINVEFPEAYEALRGNFNTAVQSLANALGSVRVGAAALNNSIGEIRAASDDLAQRNEEQAASLEETSAAMNEVTSSVRATAAGAATVKHTITQAQQEATEGGEVVTRAVDAMAAIEKSAQQITQIIELIDGIAFQTNLLALNAGVEAARAGDAGRGFAVVANEVRALAQRSADAAKDIKELIHTSCMQVSEGVALVGETGDKLAKIVTRVDEITVLINDIASAAERQAANLQQVNASVNEMDRVTQQNAAMEEETTAATRSLADEAGQLSGLVTSFRTRDVSTRPAHVRNPGALRRRSATDAAASAPSPSAGADAGRPRANRDAIAGIAAGRGAGREGGREGMADAVGQDWSEF